MTALSAAPSDTEMQDASIRSWQILLVGLFGGLAVGIAARAWMRLIAEDPEFTWNGTIFIIAAFTIFGVTQSIVAAVRTRTRRRWTLSVGRLIGTIGFLPLFVGAGSLMLPTVVGGGFALVRTDWNRLLRAVCALAAMGPVVIVGSQLVGDFGWSVHAAAGFFAMVAIYGMIIAATRFTIRPSDNGWQLPRRARIVIFVILTLVLAHSLVGFVG